LFLSETVKYFPTEFSSSVAALHASTVLLKISSLSCEVKMCPEAEGGGLQPLISPESAYTPSNAALPPMFVPHSLAKNARAEALRKSQDRAEPLRGGQRPGALPTQSSQKPLKRGSSTILERELYVTEVQKALV
jgi:hypothetical protein